MNDLKIKEIRENNGLTQEELANKLGVSARTIQNWENGGTIPATSKAKIHEMFPTGDGNTIASNIGGDNQQNSGKVIDALARQLDEKDRQIAKSQEQIDRLLTIIENMNRK